MALALFVLAHIVRCPRRVSYNRVPKCPTEVPARSRKNIEYPTKVSHKNVPQVYLVRMSSNSVAQEEELCAFRALSFYQFSKVNMSDAHQTPYTSR